MPVPNDIFSAALSITEAQASQRPMTSAEIKNFLRETFHSIKHFSEEVAQRNDNEPRLWTDFLARFPAIKDMTEDSFWSQTVRTLSEDSITEDSITCLVCGQKFDVLNAEHLATHNITVEEYIRKLGFPPTIQLSAKKLWRNTDVNHLPIHNGLGQEPTNTSSNTGLTLTFAESVGDDFITCLVCGEQLKVIDKRHLRKHKMSIEEYYKKYDIPEGTPLTSKQYTQNKLKVESPLPTKPVGITAEESITYDCVICLECGEELQLLDIRHLKKHNLTKEAYLKKHGFEPNTKLASGKVREEKRSQMERTKIWEYDRTPK